MKFYSQSEINVIFSTAEKVLWRLIDVCQTEKKGGYLSLYQFDIHCEPVLLGMVKLGFLSDQLDPEYGSKSLKYRVYAENKCKHIVCSCKKGKSHVTSAQTPFAIKGGIRVNNSLVLAFSGLDQDQDEVLVIATVQSLHDVLAGVLTEDGELISMKKFRSVSKNPLLQEEVFKKLLV